MSENQCTASCNVGEGIQPNFALLLTDSNSCSRRKFPAPAPCRVSLRARTARLSLLSCESCSTSLIVCLSCKWQPSTNATSRTGKVASVPYHSKRFEPLRANCRFKVVQPSIIGKSIPASRRRCISFAACCDFSALSIHASKLSDGFITAHNGFT